MIISPAHKANLGLGCARDAAITSVLARRFSERIWGSGHFRRSQALAFTEIAKLTYVLRMHEQSEMSGAQIRVRMQLIR
jgi:hypothetical protein